MVIMAERATLKVDRRTDLGKWKMRRLRSEGIVPGVLYGHGEETISVQLPTHDLTTAVRRGARVVDLTGVGKQETALIRELQWDTFGNEIIHVDFTRVSADERIHVEVRLTLRGTAPGVEEGGVLSHLVHTIEIECLATDIPDEIKVDVRGLHMDQAVHVKDLQLPTGVKVLADPDVVVAQVTKKLEELEVAPAAEAAAAAEPEIVGRRVAEEPPAGEEKPEKGKDKK